MAQSSSDFKPNEERFCRGNNDYVTRYYRTDSTPTRGYNVLQRATSNRMATLIHRFPSKQNIPMRTRRTFLNTCIAQEVSRPVLHTYAVSIYSTIVSVTANCILMVNSKNVVDDLSVAPTCDISFANKSNCHLFATNIS